MTPKFFKKLWDGSGLEDHYSRMDYLATLGFAFDKHGDLDHFQALALHDWLTDERGITDVSMDELKEASTTILALAEGKRNWAGEKDFRKI